MNPRRRRHARQRRKYRKAVARIQWQPITWRLRSGASFTVGPDQGEPYISSTTEWLFIR